MSSVLKKIFSGKSDEEVHSDFLKFGRGEFKNKYLIEAKKQKDKWSIKTGPEFANFLVRRCLEESSGKIAIKGVIVATFDISKDAGFETNGIKQFMGVKQVIVNSEIEPGKVISLMNRYPRAFFALSFATSQSELKIKPKAPKGAKPSAKGEKEPKAGFCSLKTSDRKTVDELFFDFPDFKEIRINHTLKINEIIIPKNESDPVRMRENSKRKGIIERKIVVDGSEKVKEQPFEA